MARCRWSEEDLGPEAAPGPPRAPKAATDPEYSSPHQTVLPRNPKNSTTIYRCREKCTVKVNGSPTRTPPTGSTWAGHENKDCSFGRQGSHAIVPYDSVPADCIEKVVSPQGDIFFFNQRFSTPRPAPKSSSKAQYQAAGDPLRRKIHLKLISEFKEFHKMQCSKVKEE